MMSKQENGGPAFPIAEVDHQTFSPKTLADVRRLLSGMTLRDYFAAKALPVASTFYDTSDEVIEEAAAWSYRMADAMIRARSA